MKNYDPYGLGAKWTRYLPDVAVWVISAALLPIAIVIAMVVGAGWAAWTVIEQALQIPMLLRERRQRAMEILEQNARFSKQ